MSDVYEESTFRLRGLKLSPVERQSPRGNQRSNLKKRCLDANNTTGGSKERDIGKSCLPLELHIYNHKRAKEAVTKRILQQMERDKKRRLFLKNELLLNLTPRKQTIPKNVLIEAVDKVHDENNPKQDILKENSEQNPSATVTKAEQSSSIDKGCNITHAPGSIGFKGNVSLSAVNREHSDNILLPCMVGPPPNSVNKERTDIELRRYFIRELRDNTIVSNPVHNKRDNSIKSEFPENKFYLSSVEDAPSTPYVDLDKHNVNLASDSAESKDRFSISLLWDNFPIADDTEHDLIRNHPVNSSGNSCLEDQQTHVHNFSPEFIPSYNTGSKDNDSVAVTKDDEESVVVANESKRPPNHVRIIETDTRLIEMSKKYAEPRLPEPSRMENIRRNPSNHTILSRKTTTFDNQDQTCYNIDESANETRTIRQDSKLQDNTLRPNAKSCVNDNDTDDYIAIQSVSSSNRTDSQYQSTSTRGSRGKSGELPPLSEAYHGYVHKDNKIFLTKRLVAPSHFSFSPTYHRRRGSPSGKPRVSPKTTFHWGEMDARVFWSKQKLPLISTSQNGSN